MKYKRHKEHPDHVDLRNRGVRFISLLQGIEILTKRPKEVGRGWDRYTMYTEKQAAERGIRFRRVEEIAKLSLVQGDWLSVHETRGEDGTLILPRMVLPVIDFHRQNPFYNYGKCAVLKLPTRIWEFSKVRGKLYTWHAMGSGGNLKVTAQKHRVRARWAIEEFENGITNQQRDMVYYWLNLVRQGESPTRAAETAYRKSHDRMGLIRPPYGMSVPTYTFDYVLRTSEYMRLAMHDKSDLHAAMEKAGLTYDWFVQRIMQEAEREDGDRQWALQRAGYMLRVDDHVEESRKKATLPVGEQTKQLAGEAVAVPVEGGRVAEEEDSVELTTKDAKPKKGKS